MTVSHTRSGVPHNGPDFFSHQRLIAIHRTFRTDCLALLEGALLEVSQRVISEFNTFGAQFVTPVMLAAVQGYHHLNRFAFPGYSGGFC